MASIDEGLFEAVKSREVQGMIKNEAMLHELSGLEIIVNNVNEILRPSSQDYDDRRKLICTFNEIARKLYGDDKCPTVKEFGSFLMQIFSPTSDLDLSIDFLAEEIMVDRFLQITTLRKFAKKFYVLRTKGIFTNIQIILSARVPVVKVTDRRTGVECDLSVGNLDGIAKSQFLLMVSAIDERFSVLSMLVKAWAKAHDINSSKDGTMSSWSLILLVAFHLQTRDIPVLPPFSAILKDGLDPNDVQKHIHRFQNYGKNNKESVSQLFVSLLVKLESVENFWSDGLCASTYEGSWIRNKLGCMSIEDFVDRSQNACRSLKSKKMTKVYHAIKHSLKQISLFSKGTIDGVKLKDILFGEVSVKTSKTSANTNFHSPLQPSPSTSKRKKQRQWKRLVAKYLGEDKLKTESDTPSNVEGPAPSKAGDSRAKNSSITSCSETSQSRKIQRVTYQPHAVTGVPYYQSSPNPDLNHTNHGTHDTGSHSVRVHSFHNLSIPPPRDMIAHSNLILRDIGGYRHEAPQDLRAYSGLPIRDIGGYGRDGIYPGTHGYTPHPQPRFPAAPFTNVIGFQTPYGHHTAAHHLARPPYAHSEVSRDRRAYDDREIHGHRLYPPYGHPSSMPFKRY